MRAIFFVPSFYGALGWTLTFILYFIGPITWNPLSLEAIAIFVAYYISFLTSVVLLTHFYELRLLNSYGSYSLNGFVRMIIALHCTGLLGLAIYIIDFSREFGGLKEFFFVLVADSLEIRGLAGELTSLGTQVGYAGWIAIWLSVYVFRTSGFRPTLLILSLVQFLGNLLYIDRVKPTWITFVAVLIGIAAGRNIRTSLVIRAIIGMLGFSVLGFLLYIIWTGKGFYEGGNFVDALHALAEMLSLYSVGGIAYFNHIIQNEHIKVFSLQRTLRPIFTILHQAGLTEPPPSYILDFYYLPHPTNVGTIFELFYRDGGVYYVVPSIFIFSFGIDIVALYFFQKSNPFALIIWSTLCFSSFFTIFAAYFNSIAFSIMVFYGLMGCLTYCYFRRKKVVSNKIWMYSQVLRTH